MAMFPVSDLNKINYALKLALNNPDLVINDAVNGVFVVGQDLIFTSEEKVKTIVCDVFLALGDLEFDSLNIRANDVIFLGDTFISGDLSVSSDTFSCIRGALNVTRNANLDVSKFTLKGVKIHWEETTEEFDVQRLQDGIYKTVRVVNRYRSEEDVFSASVRTLQECIQESAQEQVDGTAFRWSLKKHHVNSSLAVASALT